MKPTTKNPNVVQCWEREGKLTQITKKVMEPPTKSKPQKYIHKVRDDDVIGNFQPGLIDIPYSKPEKPESVMKWIRNNDLEDKTTRQRIRYRRSVGYEDEHLLDPSKFDPVYVVNGEKYYLHRLWKKYGKAAGVGYWTFKNRVWRLVDRFKSNDLTLHLATLRKPPRKYTQNKSEMVGVVPPDTPTLLS